MIERLGQRMTEFVGTTGAKVLRAIEEVVPGIEPPRRRRVTLGRVLMAVGAAAAAAAAKPLRDALERAGSSGSSGSRSSGSNGRSSSGSSSTSKASRSAKQAKDKAAELADKSRSELYELAQKADIDGRSSMSKDELVKALKKATPS